MSNYDFKTPRLHLVESQLNNLFDKLLQIIQTQKLQKRSEKRLWDIYRQMSQVQRAIIGLCGTPPADIVMQSNDAPTEIHEISVRLQNMQSSIDAMNMRSNVTENITERIIERQVQRTSSIDATHTEYRGSSNTVSKEYRVAFKRDYIRLLNDMDHHDYKSDTVHRLAHLLYRWYTTRFRPKTSESENSYTYGLQQITQGLYTVVLTFADSVSRRTVDDYMSTFDSWLDAIGSDQYITDNQTLPIDVGMFMYKLEDIPIHTETLLLWHILIAPFNAKTNSMYNKYTEALDPDFIKDLAYKCDYDAVLDEYGQLCNDGNIPYSTLVRYCID